MAALSAQCSNITQLAVDVIVNAANTSLLGGGGVDGAIHRAAGPELLEACRRIARCPVGEARITPGFKLPARYIIHTVGPYWQDGMHGEPQALASCYSNSLALAAEYSLPIIAFPCISTGAYRYPKDQAAAIAVKSARTFLLEHSQAPIQHVIFCCFDENDLARYQKLLG